MAKLLIGCSGFSYKHWKGTFYPQELPQKQWFEFYRSIFRTVELNVTFYRTPSAETFRHWNEESEPDFTFAVKGSRYITHIKRLLDGGSSLNRFLTPVAELKEKVRVILWQFPPQFKLDLQRLDAFLRELSEYPYRNTFEFRNETWLTPEVVDLCRRNNVSLCMADHPHFLDEPPITSDFVYIRRHGMEGSYNGDYGSEQLAKDARRIASYLGRGLDVYIYFNNDMGGCAPRNAAELSRLLKDFM